MNEAWVDINDDRSLGEYGYNVCLYYISIFSVYKVWILHRFLFNDWLRWRRVNFPHGFYVYSENICNKSFCG